MPSDASVPGSPGRWPLADTFKSVKWLRKLMFWRDDAPAFSPVDDVVEAVEGFTVDGCFTLPDDPEGLAAEVPGERSPNAAPPESG